MYLKRMNYISKFDSYKNTKNNEVVKKKSKEKTFLLIEKKIETFDYRKYIYL